MTPMDTAIKEPGPTWKTDIFRLSAYAAGVGFLFFIFFAVWAPPEKAWLIYLTNFLFFTALSAGGLLFSTMMHFTKATSGHNVAKIAEAFSAFFPVSFILFIFLFIGQTHVFPWVGEDLHGKEVWLNIPFLFTRDVVGFLILYLLGFGYLYHSLELRLKKTIKETPVKNFLFKYFEKSIRTPETIKKRMTLFAGWYMFAFAMVLALVGFDLVMSMDPHWYSTLFGAYSFIKAIYGGFGAIILLVSILHLHPDVPFTVSTSQLRDISTLFFGFSIVWGDFFYSQFVVIWYGNIPEETAYIIERTMTQPWRYFAWTVFIVCFIMPFLVLLNRKIKETPWCMIIISSIVLTGLWIEHFLLLGPNYLHHDPGLFLIGVSSLVITLGFIALMVMAIAFYFKEFPELLAREIEGVVQWK